MTPTIRRAGPYRFFFYSGDRDEPPHVHVERESNRAKFWLDPIRLCESGGFNRSEIRRVTELVHDHREEFLKAWHDYFDN